MGRMSLGICQRALNLPLRRCLPAAVKLGATGLEIDAVGDLFPTSLGPSARREVLHLLRSHQLDLAALAAPLRQGLDVPEHQEARIDYLRQVMTLSFDLGCRAVLVEPGPIPTDEKDPRFTLLFEALLALGQHGDRIGATLLLHTGLDAAETVLTFLAKLDTGGLALAYGPGNFLVHGHDAYKSARMLGSHIRYVQAADARRTAAAHLARRVPVGRGDIDWLELIAVFAEIEYRGYLIVDAEPGPNAQTELAAGVAFLKRFTM